MTPEQQARDLLERLGMADAQQLSAGDVVELAQLFVRIDDRDRALHSIRRAAGSAQSFTNRLQFIYERAGCALADEAWTDDWKAQYGYQVRERTLLVNDELRQEIAQLKNVLRWYFVDTWKDHSEQRFDEWLQRKVDALPQEFRP